MVLDYLLNDDSTILDAVWCKDSETSKEYLIEIKTGNILLTKNSKGEMVNPDEEI